MRMRQKPWFVWGFLLGLVLISQSTRAQYSADSQTNIISGKRSMAGFNNAAILYGVTCRNPGDAELHCGRSS